MQAWFESRRLRGAVAEKRRYRWPNFEGVPALASSKHDQSRQQQEDRRQPLPQGSAAAASTHTVLTQGGSDVPLPRLSLRVGVPSAVPPDPFPCARELLVSSAGSRSQLASTTRRRSTST
eukprot:s2246_g1.t2